MRQFDGRHYILEEAIRGDFALVKGWKADWYGNVVYRHTAQNFNPLMATAGRITVVEVEEIVPPGELPPSAIHTPGIYVDRLIVGQSEKRIEQRTCAPEGSEMLTREQMACASPRSYATATTSTSGSVSRRWWPITFPPVLR